MSTEYDYNVLANFNVNIRVEKNRLIETGGDEPLKMNVIPYSQAKLDKSDMEDILESANSIAENTTVFYKENSEKTTLTDEQVTETFGAIREAIHTLVDNVTNEDWLRANVRILHQPEPNNPQSGLSSYIYTQVEGDMETKVYLTYMPNILSAVLIYPNRPGAIINNFSQMEY